MPTLFTPIESGLPVVSSFWCLTKDGDPLGYELFRRHYSVKNKRPKIRQFVGPGEPLVLISHEGDALFVWRKFIDDSGQQGVNCAVFRNEGPNLSSLMILEAEQLAWAKWPGTRFYTTVSEDKTRKRRSRHSQPGECFIRAGWKRCPENTKSGLAVLEKLPETEQDKNSS